jgi:hypothetical protein
MSFAAFMPGYLQSGGSPQGQVWSGLTPSTVRWFSDGSVAPNTSAYVMPADWFFPNQPGIGASYWIKVHSTGGALSLNVGSLDSWISLNQGSGLIVSVSGSPGIRTGTYQISSNSNGTPVVASGSFTISNVS